MRYRQDSDCISVHWGIRFAKGVPTGQECVVVLTRRKRPLGELPAKKRCDPVIVIKQGGRAIRIPIDVQAAGSAGTLHGAVRPGRLATVSVAGGSEGTLSAVITSNGAALAVLSGHAAGSPRRKVTATTDMNVEISLGSTRRVVLTDTVDAASAGPLDSRTVDQLARPAAELRVPDSSLLNEKVFFLLARDFQPVPSYVTDVDASAPFNYEDGIRSLNGLLSVYPQVTAAGDSGAPVVDFNSRLIGFVLGSLAGKTYVIPAGRVCDALA